MPNTVETLGALAGVVRKGEIHERRRVCDTSSMVTSVAISALKRSSICDDAVAVSPSTATNVPTPRMVPTEVSAERAGRCVIPARDSAKRSRRRRREGSTTPPRRHGSSQVNRPTSFIPEPARSSVRPGSPASGFPAGHRRIVGDEKDRRALVMQLLEEFEDRVRRRRIEVPGGLVTQEQEGPPTNARAMAARWRSPPERVVGRACIRSPRPTRSSTLRASAVLSTLLTPR